MPIFYLFDFRSLWSPYFAIFLLFITVICYLITVKYRHFFKGSKPPTKKQIASFIGFVTILYIIKGSPIDLMSHMMLTMHMLQMAFLLLIMPILFIHSIPTWLWRALLNIRVIKFLFHHLTKPVVALLLFNVGFSVYHVPLILDFSKTTSFYHASIHTLLFFLAIFMFWPVINPLKEYDKMSGILKTGYMFANGVLMLPACALIIFANDPMYQTYSDPEALINALTLCATPSSLSELGSSSPELISLFNPLGVLQDQQLGGIIMKVVQEIVYGAIIAKIFFEWYRKDQEEAFEETVNFSQAQSNKDNLK
ncbi:cytochrome c oxidase assembly factor CtaG [Siminovitchia terrae]|uniref:cytochrome c oxidase assembly factor CtaG n=1 Tax=Siminovitchia terrae TaxID=1914933 RepID=UPI001BB39D1B|nr:cytochrome c oxidase assembly factor CtaG [Siminovitchia terrae]